MSAHRCGHVLSADLAPAVQVPLPVDQQLSKIGCCASYSGIPTREKPGLLTLHGMAREPAFDRWPIQDSEIIEFQLETNAAEAGPVEDPGPADCQRQGTQPSLGGSCGGCPVEIAEASASEVIALVCGPTPYSLPLSTPPVR